MKNLIIFLTLFLTSTIVAQDTVGTYKNWTVTWQKDVGLSYFKKGNLKKVVPIEADTITKFYSPIYPKRGWYGRGTVLAKKDSLWSVYNLNNECELIDSLEFPIDKRIWPREDIFIRKGKYGLINHTGNWVLEPKYDSIIGLFSSYVAIKGDDKFLISTKDNKIGITSINSFDISGWYLVVRIDSNWYAPSTSGIINYNESFGRYKHLEFSMLVKRNGFFGMVSSDSEFWNQERRKELILKPNYKSIRETKNAAVYIVESDSGFHYCNIKAQPTPFVSSIPCEEIKILKDGYYFGRLDGQWNIINENRLIKKLQIDSFCSKVNSEFGPYSSNNLNVFGYYVAKKWNQYVLLNNKGEILLPPVSNSLIIGHLSEYLTKAHRDRAYVAYSVKDFSGELVFSLNKNKKGLLNQTNILMPPIYDDINFIGDTYVGIKEDKLHWFNKEGERYLNQEIDDIEYRYKSKLYAVTIGMHTYNYRVKDGQLEQVR